MSDSANCCICKQCKKEIKTQLIRCLPCDNGFHPSCHKLHKMYSAENELVNCNGKYEILTIKDKSGKYVLTMKRTLSQTDESQQEGSSMEKKIDWLVYKIKEEMISKKEIKNLFTDIVKYETENVKKEMEEMKRMIGNLKKEMKDEIQLMVNTSLERSEVKKSYNGIVKGNQTESVMVISLRMEKRTNQVKIQREMLEK